MRAEVPATPAQEHGSVSARLSEGSPLTLELAQFIQSGLSIVVAAVGADRRPLAGVALACRVAPSGEVRVALRRPAALALLAAFAQGSAIAVTFSRPITNRSIQLKATRAAECPRTPEDEAELARQTAAFRDELRAVEHDEPFARLYTAYEAAEITVLAFTPERAFVQTPGPGAGAELANPA